MADEYRDIISGGIPAIGLNNAPVMTLRDWFAGKAMMMYMESDDLPSDVDVDELRRAVASCSYKMADAMMKAREAK